MLTEAITSVLQGKWIGHEQHGGVHLLDKVKTAEDRFLCVSFGAAFTLCFHIIPRNEPDTIVPLFSQKCRRQNKVVFLFLGFLSLALTARISQLLATTVHSTEKQIISSENMKPLPSGLKENNHETN